MVNQPSQTPEASVEQPLTMTAPQTVQHVENALKDLYFVSGLGADKRVFRLLKIEGYQPVYIRWLDPERGESIEAYAKRLTEQIKSDKPILVGLSFGGMISVEMAKHIEIEKVILISSVKDRFEIPPYFRAFRWFPVHRVFPFKSLLWAGYGIADWFFSIADSDEKKLLKAILVDTDAQFIKWALHKVVTWKNETISENLYHIHGMSDRIFPIRFVQSDIAVEHGGHFMIMNQAAQISNILKKIMS